MFKRNRTVVLAGALVLEAFARIQRKKKRISFYHRVVVVTGGSRGLGLILAKRFAGQGAHVAICARDPDEVENARKVLESQGISVFAGVCDISRRDEVEKFFAEVREELGPIDVLVNNAGIMRVGPFANIGERDLQETMDVNFWGMVHATYASLPDMIRRKSGRIVNITSIGGMVSIPHLLPYSVAKFAAVGFSQGIQSELARESVYVTTVVPGLMRTGSFVNASFKGRRASEFRWFKLGAITPLLSMNAERAAEEIIEACRHARPEITLGLPAKLFRRFHALYPNLSARLLASVNRILPSADSAPEAREAIPEPGRLYGHGSWDSRKFGEV